MSLRDGALLGLIAFLGFWLGSWDAPLFDLDEGAFSQATLEMLRSGNYLVTTLDGAPRYDKPMLTYWLQGAFVLLLGEQEFAFRLHSMLCATLWMVLVFNFVRARATAPESAWLAAGALGLGLMSSIVGHAATADALLNLLLAATFLDLYRYFETVTTPQQSTARRRALVLRLFAWMGLGLLAKGPVAVVLPAAAGLIFFWREGQLRAFLSGLFHPLGWLLLLAIVLPWSLAAWQADGGEFIRHFLLDHNLGRYADTLHGHGGQWHYYLVALPLIVLPFTALLPAALSRGWRGGEALDRWCLTWFAVVFVLFSFSKTQLPHYLLYGATPLFVLIGRTAPKLPGRRWLLAPGLLLLVVFAALPLLLEALPVKQERAWEAGILAEAQRALDGGSYVALCLAGLAVAALGAWRLRPAPALLVLAGAQALVVWTAVAPAFAQAQQAPIREAARMARGEPVVAFQTRLPSFSVYRGAPTRRALPAPGELAFLRADRLDELQAQVPAAELQTEFRRGGVLLVRRLPGPSDRPPSASRPMTENPP